MDGFHDDRTAGRIAICSAIFAGFAYVGFAVFRTAVYRKQDDKISECGNNSVARVNEPQDELKVCIRRLSVSSQTDQLLNNLDVTHMAAGMVFKPMSVQERIKQLNHQSRRFDGAIAAVAIRSSSAFRARSLQGSPWNSPRILSPVDVEHFLSRSVENLTMTEQSSVASTPRLCRRRTTLGPRNKSPMGHYQNYSRNRSVSRELSPSCSGLNALACESGTGGLASSLSVTGGNRSRSHSACSSRSTSELNLSNLGTQIDGHNDHPNTVTEVHILLKDNEETLRRRLDDLYNKGRVLSTLEVRSLVALLSSTDTDLLQRALTTVANCAAFTVNQNYLRDEGCLTVLGSMLTNPQLPLNIAASVIQAMGNLALNVENQKQLKNYIPILLDLTDVKEGYPENIRLLSLITLTNLAVCEHTHEMYIRSLNLLYEILDLGSSSSKLQVSRLLVNLASNPLIVPHLLAAKVKAPERILDLLSLRTDEELLLRLVTLISHLTVTVQRESIEALDLPTDCKAPSPETMYAAIYGLHAIEKIKNKVFVLTKSRQEDIKAHAKAIYDCLKVN